MSEPSNVFIGPDVLGIIGGIGFIITAVILFNKIKKYNKLFETNEILKV